MDIPHYTSTDKTVPKGDEMGVLLWIVDRYISEFDVQVLINRLELSRNSHVVLEFDFHWRFLLDKLLEKLKK